MKQTKILYLTIVLLFSGFVLRGQGWDKTFTSPLGDTTFAFNAIETIDSGFVFAGGSFFRSGQNIGGSHPFVSKVDKRGNVIWIYSPTDLVISDTVKVIRTLDNAFMVLTTDVSRLLLGLPSVLVIKLNENGIEQFRKYYLNGSSFKDADITPELDRIVVTAYQGNGNAVLGANLLQLSTNGDSLSRRFYKDIYLASILFGGDQQIYAAKYQTGIDNGINSSGSGIIKFNLQGDSLWQSEPTDINDQFFYLKRANDGRILVNGNTKFDYDGRVVFHGAYNFVPVTIFSYIFTQKKGDNSIYTFFPVNPLDLANYNESYYSLVKKDSIGRYVLKQQLVYNSADPDNRSLENMIATSDGGFLLTGKTSRIGGKARLHKLNKDGLTYANIIKGKIYIDSIQNCRLDSSEKGFPNRLVSIKKNNETNWAGTDFTGNYEAQTDTGIYVVSSFLSNSNWRLCTPAVSKQFSTYGIVDSLNFATQAVINCAQMRISVSLNGLRRCFDNTIAVNYSNEGTIIAQGAFITLKLDSLLEYLSATRPLSSRQGQTLRFDLGDVPINNSGTFYIHVYVKCGDSTRIGQTLCTEAHIFPDTICNPPANWSGANVVVNGRCDRDSVRFLIKNTSGVSTAPLRRIIIEDEIVFLNENRSIAPNASQTIAFPANGKTWRLNQEQEPNNPRNTVVSAVVEGCRVGTNTFSTGFVNDFPNNTGDPSVSISCLPIRGSYDPNEKLAFPEGFKNEHFIEQNTPIDYQIGFQNTGNDTAFTVILRDTLHDALDIATLKMGASSHPFTWDLVGKNVLTFTFNNIHLVDSFKNEAASHGFVKFRINQKKDVKLGTRIENQAAIYFDFNAPIFTNTTFHTVGKNIITVSIAPVFGEKTTVQVSPNPFSEMATFEMPPSVKTGIFMLFDINGKVLRRENFVGNSFEFHKKDLPTGIFIFKITTVDGRLIGQGKVVAQ